MNIEVNGVNLNYEKVGSGYPLIMLHGNGEDLSIFKELSEKLKDKYEIYLVDSRNHGKSSSTKEISYDDMREDIKEFIEKLNIKKPNVVGFSDGAIIATMIEIKYPNTFNKMALLGINLSPSDFKDKIYNIMKDKFKDSKNPLEILMLNEPNISLEDLSKINRDIMFFYGDYDLFKDALYDNLKKALPKAIHKEMVGYDHASYIENKDVIYKDLINFFN